MQAVPSSSDGSSTKPSPAPKDSAPPSGPRGASAPSSDSPSAPATTEPATTTAAPSTSSSQGPPPPAPPKPKGPWAAAVLRSAKPIDPKTAVRLPMRGASPAPPSGPSTPTRTTSAGGKGAAAVGGRSAGGKQQQDGEAPSSKVRSPLPSQFGDGAWEDDQCGRPRSSGARLGLNVFILSDGTPSIPASSQAAWPTAVTLWC